MEIPGYKVVRELGRGGMATVYLAEQEKFERQVALKVMASSLNSDASFKERFIREAKLVAKLSHPNIVAVYDVGEHDGHVYMAMEYHTGGDLKAKAKAGMSPAETVRVTCEMARALEFAHSKGVIHRDIKPDNILFRSDGSAVLTDFGIAKQGDAQTQFTQMGMVAGTPKYMSPEQARGLPLDAESDLYSLGIVFYECITGDVPFKAEDSIALAIKHLKDPPPPLPTPLKKFQPFLDRILAKEPARRYHRGGEVAKVLEDIMASGGIPNPNKVLNAPPPANEPTQVRPAITSPLQDSGGGTVDGSRRNKGFLLGGLAVAVALAGGGGWYITLGPGAAAESQEVVSSVVEPSPVEPVSTPEASGVGAVSSAEPAAPETAPAEVASPEPVAPPVAAVQVEAEPPAVVQPPPAPVVNRAADASALVAKGQSALSKGRFDSPVGSSAYDYFRQALAVDPKNRKAQDGMKRIADHFVAQADKALANNDIPEAKAHLRSAERVAPGYGPIGDAATRIAGAAVLAGASRKAEPAPAPAPPPVAPVAIVEPQPVVAAPPPVPTADPSAVRNRLRASGLASKGTTLYKQGDYASAKSLFDQALALDPANQSAIDGLEQLKQQGM